MKKLLTVLALMSSVTASAQAWKTLPKGVRILGYRNVMTSKVTSNFNNFRSQTNLGASFRLDAATINEITGSVLVPGQNINADAYNQFLVGEYKVDAAAQFNVHGMGFGYGITDRVMFYVEGAYYNAVVKSNIKRTRNNTYGQTSGTVTGNGGLTDDTLANNLPNLPDVTAGVIQSAITNEYGYKPIGDWYGKGYGDMETGVMIRAIDKGVWGLLLYPGVTLPTGRVDDPDMLQDMGFGDGQYDVFGELATGYVFNDRLSLGTTFRYTYQAPTSKTLRVPESRDFPLSYEKGDFNVKYGDRLNWMVNTTYAATDWLSFTPIYRFMYQMQSAYSSSFGEANSILSDNSDKYEHQIQLTTTISSIKPFLKKEFLLPAQINLNVLQTVAGKNVPNVGRFEVEFRMLF